jgi:hypothetical protein
MSDFGPIDVADGDLASRLRRFHRRAFRHRRRSSIGSATPRRSIRSWLSTSTWPRRRDSTARAECACALSVDRVHRQGAGELSSSIALAIA